MDPTPIYTELQQTLTDPEENNWGPSAPPEFAAALTAGAERSRPEKGNAAKSSSEKGGKRSARRSSGSRSGGRRHRAED